MLKADVDVSALSEQNLRISQGTGNGGGISQIPLGRVELIH